MNQSEITTDIATEADLDVEETSVRPSRLIGWLLVAILLVSYCLRVYLAHLGGQDYWVDTRRYERGKIFSKSLSAGEGTKALQIFLRPDHSFSTLVGAVPYAIRLGLRNYFNDDRPYRFIHTAYLPLFSLACIALLFGIAYRSGLGVEGALLAAFLAACSNGLFYFSRHRLGYDAGLALALLGLWIGLQRKFSLRLSIFCALALSCSFLTYNGYWVLVLAVLATHILFGAKERTLLKRTLVLGLVFPLPILLMHLLSYLSGAPSYLGGMLEFSRTVKLGDLHEGWFFILEYLWHVEHGLLILWLFGCASSIYLAFRSADPRQRIAPCQKVQIRF